MLLQYVIPGYWATLLFKFFCSKKADGLTVFILSCVLSYLSITIITIFHEFDNALVLSGISFLLLTVITIIASMVYSSQRFKKLLIRIFHRTPNKDIWLDVLDLSGGSNLQVYLKGKDYYLRGHYKVHEEKGEDSWFAISAYVIYDAKTNKVIDEQFKHELNAITTFRLKDVERIDVL